MLLPTAETLGPKSSRAGGELDRMSPKAQNLRLATAPPPRAYKRLNYLITTKETGVYLLFLSGHDRREQREHEPAIDAPRKPIALR